MKTLLEPKPNCSLSQLIDTKGTFFHFKVVFFPKIIYYSSSKITKKLQDIKKGNHDDRACRRYCQRYKEDFGQELPDCQFKGNKSKLQDLIRKVHIDSDGSVNEVQFGNNISEGTKSLRTRMKNLFHRK